MLTHERRPPDWIISTLVGACCVAGIFAAIGLALVPQNRMLVLNAAAFAVAALCVAVYVGVYYSWARGGVADSLPVPTSTATAATAVNAPAQPVESAPMFGDHAFLTVARGAPAGGLSLNDRNVVNMFARQHGPHTLYVVAAGDSSAAIAYATSLADAFESGGWSVEGRAHDADRTVAKREGALLPSEPDIAVSPEHGLGSDVRELLERVHLHPSDWVPSLNTASSDVLIWIGRAPRES